MMGRTTAALFAVAVLSANAAPESMPDFAPLTIGETSRVTVLKTEREMNVILPAEHEQEREKNWSMVIMIDGGQGQDLMMGVGVQN